MYKASNKERTNNYFMDSSYDDLVKQYGADNAKYLYETLYKKADELPLYISFGLDIDKEAEKENFDVIKGDLKIIDKVINCNFDDDFLMIMNEKVKLIYDFEKIIDTEKKG